MSIKVCLLLEGTYPYVSGGVASCVHQLISMLPNISFHLVYIGANVSEHVTPKYKLPTNVVGMSEIYLYSDGLKRKFKNLPLSRLQADRLSKIHAMMHGTSAQGRVSERDLEFFLPMLLDLLASSRGGFDFSQHFLSKDFWEILMRDYGQLCRSPAFVDFYYSWQSAHLPVYTLMSADFPQADIYHSLSTGYAGLAGAIASARNSGAFVVTEHGIYAHERELELASALWLQTEEERADAVNAFQNPLRQWWIDYFYNLAAISYRCCDRVVTLFKGNSERQISAGARRDHAKVIANGIGDQLEGLRRQKGAWNPHGENPKFIIGFVGRIVSIKDIKTLIKSVATVLNSWPSIECWIVGPTDEEPLYVEECERLSQLLGLNDILHFKGKCDVKVIYPEIDCLILTSLSEAQPMVILEASSAGIPVVATDVGACREMLEGALPADRAIGLSGLLAPVADPIAIAEQVLKLIRNPNIWNQMSLAGIERVRRFYDERTLLARYEVMYRQLRSQHRAAA